MYEEYFGLTGKPFQLSPDASFFFPSKEHKRALSFLEYGLNQADGFIVITGDVGTGKTTLVQTLLQRLDQREMMVATLVTTQLAEDDLLQLVAVNLGVRVANSNKATLLRDLERVFIQQAQQNRRVLLIVDEAQNLPPRSVEELRMLSNFQLNGRPLVQVFLLGQEEFRATLLSEGFEQLRQRVIATYHLNPLSDDETRTYIEHRLHHVGWKDDPRIEDSAFQSIFNFCEGVPRRVNNLCDRLLLYAFLEEKNTLTAEVVETVAKEIGTEFWGGRPGARAATEAAAVSETQPLAGVIPGDGTGQVFNTPGQPLETMARVMFDKANVQQRLASIERAVDSMGHDLKPEIAALREEMQGMRQQLDQLLQQLRQTNPSPGTKSTKKTA